MAVLGLQLMDLLLLCLNFLQECLAVLLVSSFEGLELAHLDIPAVDEICAEGL